MLAKEPVKKHDFFPRWSSPCSKTKTLQQPNHSKAHRNFNKENLKATLKKYTYTLY